MSLTPQYPWLYTSFIAVLLALPLLSRLAPRLGLLDRPDARKRHRGEVPLVGGLALFVGLAVAYLVNHYGDARLAWMLGGGLLLVAVGIFDDRQEVSTLLRFAMQTAACLLMALGADVYLRDFGQLLWAGTLPLGWAAIPVTVFCVVGVTNALNMIDGMDGLSASISLVCLAGLYAALRFSGAAVGMPELPALAGGLLAYLLFNLRLPWRPRALAFFGDAGTLLLGFLLGWMLVQYSQGPARVIAPVTALWLLAVPLMDTVFVMIKRKRAGQPMTGADREHLHHAFLRSGHSVTVTLLLMVLLASLLAGTGLALEFSGLPEYLSYYVFLAACGLYYGLMSRSWRTRRFLGRAIR